MLKCYLKCSNLGEKLENESEHAKKKGFEIETKKVPNNFSRNIFALSFYSMTIETCQVNEGKGRKMRKAPKKRSFFHQLSFS